MFTPPEPAAPPLLLFAVRCPCCDLRSSRSVHDAGQLCANQCASCGGSCLGLPQRVPPQSAPPLLMRPAEDSVWQFRN